MKTVRFLFPIGAALFLLSAAIFSQQGAKKTSDVEVGIGDTGLELGQVRPMTVPYAKQIIAAAIKSSCSPPAGSCSGAFCVVDDAGVLVNLEVIDGVLAAAPKMCIAKAETPALWRRPTETFQGAVTSGTNTSYEGGSFPNMMISPGGIALFKDGRIIGGFGLAGVGAATKQIDDAVNAEATKLFGKQGR